MRNKTKNMAQRQEAEAEIQQRYSVLEGSLNERARRMFAASEARAFGWGGVIAVSRATGLSPKLIRKGIVESHELDEGATPLDINRVRRPGAGRKKATVKDPTLLRDLKEILESTTRGDPESPLLWTARSRRNLIKALADKGHKISRDTLASVLKNDLGYSLQGNKKSHEGAQHPDRNAQFEHINEVIRRQQAAGEPVISVDTKKKELVGNFKNAGKELRPCQDPERVEAYDFVDPELGKVAPYGVFDLNKNEGWVSVGISHDTAEFSVETIRTWYQEMGREAYPNATSLLITADCGGSNGYRLRLWKVELQKLADELALEIKVCHLPPGTSKWNKIEHRLFSFITQNWRGKPLVTHQVIVDLIRATKTETGLTVKCRLDERIYAKGRRVTDKELGEVNLVPDDWHGEWNYSIKPSNK